MAHIENPMKKIDIGKVIVHISVGQSGQPLRNAMNILEQITGQQPCQRVAKQTIRQFGLRKNEPMSCMVTLRGERAEEFLVKAFQAVRNVINTRSFDNQGNFAFGIREHIDIPGTRYYPNLGIVGMDVIVNLKRPGYRVKERKWARSKIGSEHRISAIESREFIENKFGVSME
jgi:large subunit ribosomal protein L5